MIVRSTVSPWLKIGLELIGVWPDVPHSVLRRCIHLFSILFIQIFQYLYVHSYFNLSSLNYLMDSLPATLYYCLTAVKVIVLWKHHGVLRELLTIADDDWCDTLNVEQYLHLMITKANISKFCAYFMITFNTVAGVLYIGTDNFVTLARLMMGYNSTSRPLPLKLLLPFDSEQSPIYELLVVVLFMHATAVVASVNFVSTLALTLVMHVSGQIEIVHQELKNFSESIIPYGSSRHSIQMIIQRHNKIISFSKNINKLFSLISLMQVLGNTLVTCFLGLIFLSTNGTPGAAMVKSAFAYCGITIEIFMFCFIGEYLGIKNKSLGNAAYESLWYNMSPKHGKNLLFIIMRSQKQLTITLGGITDLSLEAFTSIMKASASYMSILNAM